METETEAEAIAVAAVRECIATGEALLEGGRVAPIVHAAQTIADALERGGKLLLFGNGGSAADATHIAAEFVGRFQKDRRALPAMSLAADLSVITAIANDLGFEQVFARQLEANGESGDVAVAISTSGRSPNVLAGVNAARRLGLRTIGLTGRDGGDLATGVDICLMVPSNSTARVQEGHILVAHILCDLVERRLA